MKNTFFFLLLLLSASGFPFTLFQRRKKKENTIDPFAFFSHSSVFTSFFSSRTPHNSYSLYSCFFSSPSLFAFHSRLLNEGSAQNFVLFFIRWMKNECSCIDSSSMECVTKKLGITLNTWKDWGAYSRWIGRLMWGSTTKKKIPSNFISFQTRCMP